MNKSTLLLLIFLGFMAALLGWNYLEHPFQAAQTRVPATPEPSSIVPTTGAGQSAADLAALMSLTPEQKVALMIAFPLVADAEASNSAQLAWISDHHPGVITLFGSAVTQAEASDTITTVKNLYPADARPLIAVDHEGGTVQRLSGSGFSLLPAWQSLCSQPATQSAQLLDASLAQVHQVGVNMVFAPVVDVASRSGTLRTRTCSADPATVVERSIGFIQAATTQGLIPVVKHFPGIGTTTRDLHFSFDRVTVTPADALVFTYILDRYPQIGVMIAPVGVTNQYPDVPCNLSVDCIQELKAHYPKTIVISDSLEMTASGYTGATTPALSLPDRALKAVKAGNHILVFSQAVTPAQMSQVVDRLVTEYQADPEFKAQVDQRVSRLLELRRSQP